MLSLTLTIFELTEEQEDQQDEGIELRLEDCSTVSVMFHNIDYVKPVGQYCIISSGGDLFTVNESAESVNAKINERKTFLYN